MKPVEVKNEYGETIEIKWDADGKIQVRHSAFKPKAWGELQDSSKVARHPGFKSFMAKKGMGDLLEQADAHEAAYKLGGYTVINGEMYILNRDEIDLIYAAVQQHGGIIPNWSSRE